MMRRTIPAWSLRAVLAALAVVALPACDVVFQNETAVKATDHWSRTYELAETGQLEIVNPNGPVEISVASGRTVDVQAELIAHGPTEELAKAQLKVIKIVEQTTAEKVRLEVPRVPAEGGFGLGPSSRAAVSFKIAVPKNAVVRVTTRNGPVQVAGVAGAVTVETSNGPVTCTGLSGPVNASTTNGRIAVEVSAVRPEGIRLDTTNGAIDLKVPADAKGTISARWVNGGFHADGVQAEGETSRRHYDGKLNGGGPPIELSTTNGGIRLRSKEPV